MLRRWSSPQVAVSNFRGVLPTVLRRSQFILRRGVLSRVDGIASVSRCVEICGDQSDCVTKHEAGDSRKKRESEFGRDCLSCVEVFHQEDQDKDCPETYRL